MAETQKILLGKSEDGSDHFLYHNPEGHFVFTGPTTGTVTTEDGTEYDVTDRVIEVASPEHAAQVGDAINERYSKENS